MKRRPRPRLTELRLIPNFKQQFWLVDSEYVEQSTCNNDLDRPMPFCNWLQTFVRWVPGHIYIPPLFHTFLCSYLHFMCHLKHISFHSKYSFVIQLIPIISLRFSFFWENYAWSCEVPMTNSWTRTSQWGIFKRCAFILEMWILV